MESRPLHAFSGWQAPTAPDALSVLRTETLAEHRAVEAELTLLDPALTRDHYAQILQSFYGFWEPLETRMASSEVARFSELGLEPCQRTAWLEQDLHALGHWRPDLARCPDLPRLEPGARSWGCLYVLEGAALGGRVIAKHLRDSLGIGADSGARFFIGRGEQTASHWRTVQQRLREALTESTSLAQAVEAARDTFRCLRYWLAGRAW